MKNSAILLTAGGLAFASPAAAVQYNFDITGDYSASFVLDSKPTPDASFGSSFVIGSVPGTASGNGTVYFVTAGSGGGLEIDYPGTTDIFRGRGAQLFSGSTSNPTFLTGTFSLNDVIGGGSAVLTISAPGPVPEPAVWAMMIIGFGATGGVMRRHRLRISFA